MLTAAVVVVLGAGVTTTALLVGAADGGGDEPGRTVGAPGISLVAYDTCETALEELKQRILPRVGPYGLDGGDMRTMGDGDLAVEDSGGVANSGPPAREAAPAEAPVAAPGDSSAATEKEHSTTNVHEAGVDEPDLVKTDGKRVVSVADGVLRVVDVASRAQTAAVRLDSGHATQLLLAGDRALVLTAGGMAVDSTSIAPGEPAPKPAPTDTFTYGSHLALVDLTGAGKVLGTLSVDGSYLDARQVGAVARVVVRSAPRFEFAYPDVGESPAAAVLENKDVVTRSTIEDWLPRYRLATGAGTTSGQLTDCSSVTHPADYTATAMLTVLTFDLEAELGAGDPVTIVADGNTVYGTGTTLYVADDHMAHGMGDVRTEGGGRTEVYQFDVSGRGKPVYVASGGVEGSLLNQYSLSEHDGHLRVATTTSGPRGSESMIAVLRREGDVLTEVGRVAGLGVGERIYAVRYFGTTAYVVTFRQTDPLYTVDISDPAAPKVTGELKITGYSAYLHPAGDGRLIGVGQEADQDGRVTGAQVSLFDTTDPAGARVVARHQLQNAWTEVEGDPHAFLYWPDEDLVVLPVSGGGPATPDGSGQPVAGALVLKLEGNAFRQVGVLSHTSARYGDFPVPPRRAMVIGGELWTVSEAGMLVNDLRSLSRLAWVPFA
jgi:hypothetical protein